jgi:hypothetical protein
MIRRRRRREESSPVRGGRQEVEPLIPRCQEVATRRAPSAARKSSRAARRSPDAARRSSSVSTTRGGQGRERRCCVRRQEIVTRCQEVTRRERRRGRAKEIPERGEKIDGGGEERESARGQMRCGTRAGPWPLAGWVAVAGWTQLGRVGKLDSSFSTGQGWGALFVRGEHSSTQPSRSNKQWKVGWGGNIWVQPTYQTHP